MTFFANLWCRLCHRWGHPIHGHMICMDCGRKHKIPIS